MDNIEMDLEEREGGVEWLRIGTSGRGNEPLGSMKYWEVRRLLKKGSVRLVLHFSMLICSKK
jgi:hypothetical protein